jgi:alginate O-acetyltransferase complex protein AlgI
MLFTEPLFFAFMAVVWSVYWLLPTNRSRKIWLLIASYVFYGAWDWRFLFLIFGSTAVDYVVAM